MAIPKIAHSATIARVNLATFEILRCPVLRS
jgi:hypothetical protein